MPNRIIFHRIVNQSHSKYCQGCSTSRPPEVDQKMDATRPMNKRKPQPSYVSSEGVDVDTKQAMDEHDHLDKDYEPPSDSVITKKPKCAHQHNVNAGLVSPIEGQPPVKAHNQSRHTWAQVHYNKTFKELPKAQNVSTSVPAAVYKKCMDLAVFMKTEFEYHKEAASELRKKYGTLNKKLDELKQVKTPAYNNAPPGVETKTESAKKTKTLSAASSQTATLPSIETPTTYQNLADSLATKVGDLTKALHLAQVEKEVAETELHSSISTLNSLQDEVAYLENKHKKAQTALTTATARTKSLENDLSRERTAVKNAKLKHSNRYQQIEQECQELKDRVEKLAKDVKTRDGTIESTRRIIKARDEVIREREKVIEEERVVFGRMAAEYTIGKGKDGE